MAFVLDPAGGWVSQLTLNPAGDGLAPQGEIPGLVREEQQIDGGTVRDLVDFVWIDLAGGRRTSALVILERGDGALVNYAPAWQVEGEMVQLRRSFLGVPPGTPKIVGTYDGRFYVLDADANQVRRYEASGDTYPNQPGNYFVVPPPRPLAEAVDMAIDGHIYILYAGGEIFKFLGGEAEPFEVRGVPDDLGQAIALAVDPDDTRGIVYVADPSNNRVVSLEPDGTFQAQFRADVAFDALEAVVVKESAAKLYVISDGQLYVASLP